MRRSVVLVLLAGTLALPASASASPSLGAMDRAFDTVHRRYVHDIFGICMGAIDGRTRAIKCYGRLGPGSSRRPRAGSLFQIGSISKTFTATLLALRAQQGRVGLADPLRRYIPQGDARSSIPSAMSLLDTADHYSGLPRKSPLPAALSLDQYLSQAGMCEALAGCPVGPPGGQFLYSNFAFGILGQALAVHDGFHESSYSAWERDNDKSVTGPLGMSFTRTWFGWQAFSPQTFNALRAHGTTGSPPHEPNPPYFSGSPFGDAAGMLYSSSRDMLKWLSFSMGLTGTPRLNAARHLLYDAPSIIRSRVKPFNARKEIGLAWNIDTHGSGTTKTTCISKDGASPGFTAYIVFVKGQRRGAFVMLNNNPSNTKTPTIGTDVINSLPPSSASSHRTYTCGTVPPSPDL